MRYECTAWAASVVTHYTDDEFDFAHAGQGKS